MFLCSYSRSIERKRLQMKLLSEEMNDCVLMTAMSKLIIRGGVSLQTDLILPRPRRPQLQTGS